MQKGAVVQVLPGDPTAPPPAPPGIEHLELSELGKTERDGNKCQYPCFRGAVECSKEAWPPVVS